MKTTFHQSKIHIHTSTAKNWEKKLSCSMFNKPDTYKKHSVRTIASKDTRIKEVTIYSIKFSLDHQINWIKLVREDQYSIAVYLIAYWHRVVLNPKSVNDEHIWNCMCSLLNLTGKNDSCDTKVSWYTHLKTKMRVDSKKQCWSKYRMSRISTFAVKRPFKTPEDKIDGILILYYAEQSAHN